MLFCIKQDQDLLKAEPQKHMSDGFIKEYSDEDYTLTMKIFVTPIDSSAEGGIFRS